MSPAEPALQRFRMSWEEYLELPEKPKAEWVDGEVVVTPGVSPGHGVATIRLAIVLAKALPELSLMTEVGVMLASNRLRIPDLMATATLPDGQWATDAPVLVVEVLSPSTRTEDTVRKSVEYLRGGVGQYWVLDPDLRVLDVSTNVDASWEELLRLDDETPTGEVAVGEHGTVHVDLADLLR